MSGYPEAHPDVIVEDAAQMEKNYWADIDYLKQKVRWACCGRAVGMPGLGMRRRWRTTTGWAVDFQEAHCACSAARRMDVLC